MKVAEIIKRFIRSNYVTRLIFRIYSICMDSELSIWKYFFARKRNYVFMVPAHNNAGDIAQTVCISDWLKNNYPDYITINVVQCAPQDATILREICRTVKREDNVFIHSGFNITDIGHTKAIPEAVYESHKIILEELKEHRIVFFPQTVQYESIDKWKKMQQMYAAHKNLVFISRDATSMQYAKQLIPTAKHLCYPDIVTSWIGTTQFQNEPEGILACMRFGAESLLSEAKRKKLVEQLSKIACVDCTDTNFELNSHVMRKNRRKIVWNMISQFSRYKVIVTDRYHGIIFSLIANRPVIVLPTLGHKVTSGIAWFPECFSKYVYFVDETENMDAIAQVVRKVYRADINGRPDAYFKKSYYDNLKSKIDS